MEKIVRQNFKNIRKKIGISQEEMANYLNLEQSSISKFENGERTLQISHLEKACCLFGININDLFKENLNIEILSPSFRKDELNFNSLPDIAKINQIALNIIDMKKLLEKNNG